MATSLMATHAHVDEWSAEDTSIAEVEEALADLRNVSADPDHPPDLRTSVMTHTAWVPEEWLEAARETLAGLSDRHPSRTIILVPHPEDGQDRLDAQVALECFPLPGEPRHICSEVIELHLRGRRAQAPASIVLPLLIPDLPVFCRWRGRPPFGAGVFDQLVEVVDRLVVDSREWSDPRDGLHRLADSFDRTIVSDIAWGRALPWRLALARLWPGIADAQELRVAGPESEAVLLAGWLRSRLARNVELVHEPAGEIEQVAVDGDELASPPDERRSPSDLLSDELDRFSRDPVYEAAVRAA